MEGKKALKELELLHKDVVKNKLILDKEKETFINQIKQIKKEDILPKPPEPIKKFTLWQKLIKVLMG
jgi:hypothetical protein